MWRYPAQYAPIHPRPHGRGLPAIFDKLRPLAIEARPQEVQLLGRRIKSSIGCEPTTVDDQIRAGDVRARSRR